MEEVICYKITPEKFLEAQEILEALQVIKRVEYKKILFGRWDYTNYKRIYVDVSEKKKELGYIDLIRKKFVVTAKAEYEFFTPELIDNTSKRINRVLDKFRETSGYEITNWNKMK